MKILVTITVNVVRKKEFHRYVRQCVSRGTCTFIISTQQGRQPETVSSAVFQSLFKKDSFCSCIIFEKYV